MVRSNQVKIVFIFVCFFVFSTHVFGQDKQVDENKQLREQILTVYESAGEQELLDFVKKKKDKITNKFIVDFAESGVEERKEKWLKICLILAEEKKDEKTLADVLYKKGKHFSLISENKKATDYFEKALSIYLKLNDPVGQGNVYLSKGTIYFYTGDNSKAFEMYEKALPFFEKAKYPIGQGNVHLGKGDIYFYTGYKSRAYKMYDKALPFFEKAKYPNGQGNVYKRKGDIYKRTGDNSKALAMYDKALLFYEKAGRLVGQGSVYQRKGKIYFYIGENTRALEMYDKAMIFFEKAGYPIGQCIVHLEKGDIYKRTGYNSRALRMYDKALPLFEKAGMPIGQGNVYKSKGDIYSRIGEKSKALEMYDKALPFFKKAGAPIGQGNVYKNKGNIFFYEGDNSKALEMYEKALHFFKKAGALKGQGNVYLRKGDICKRTGDNSKALEMYDKALPFFEKAGDPIGLGNVYLCKGNIYLRIGDNSRALGMYDKALPFFEKAGDLIGLGNVYKNKGNVFFYTGDNLKAFEMYDKALPFFEKVGTSLGQGNVYLRKADVYLRIGENSKALEMSDKALPFFKKAEATLGQGNVYLRKGAIYLVIGGYSIALEMYNNALPLYKKGGAIGSESLVLYGKAKVLVKLEKKEKAMELFEKGIVNLEKVRTQIAFSEMKRSFLEKAFKQYEETVLFMLENNYYDKGFKYAETMRARVFLDRMTEGLVRLDKGLIPELKKNRDNLVAKLSLLSKEIHKTAGKKDEKKLQELKKRYQKKKNEFEELLIKIRLNNPLYASVRYPQPITVQTLQKEVLKKREILLRYFISSDKVYVFLVSKKKFTVVPLVIKEKEIKGLVERYLLAFSENNSNDMRRFGKALYKKLFKPLETAIKKNRDIIIVPDGEMAKIPFESFIMDKDKSGRPVFLLEKYRLKYIQSASLLSVLRKYYTREGAAKNFIGFGDPVYDYEKFNNGLPEKGSTNPEKGDEIKEIYRGKYDREGGELVRLRGSGHEVKAIAELFRKKESGKCVEYLRENASEDNAKAKDMKEFDYIHFSCHGILGDVFQSLVLSQMPPDKSSEDGYFTLNEIMNCDYNAKLIVLSACQTGSGKMYRGEGVTGLTRAVMYAGTPAVIASLWKVDDTATKELMVRFYKNMLEKNLDKTEALRQAKLALLKKENYRSPFFWSAFVMYGE